MAEFIEENLAAAVSVNVFKGLGQVGALVGDAELADASYKLFLVDAAVIAIQLVEDAEEVVVPKAHLSSDSSHIIKASLPVEPR